MRFNSVVAAFFFIVMASIVAFIVFIQTNSFGKLVTKVISDIAEKKAHTSVGIRSIQISLFPPGIELNRVSVKKEIGPQETFEGEFGKLGFYIGLIEIEEKKLTFGEIRISDSVIDYNFPKKDDGPIKEIPQGVIDKIFDISNMSPVRVDTLLIENSKIHVNYDLLDAKRLKIFKKGDDFMLRFHIANLWPVEDMNLSVDEIWGDIEISRRNAHLYRLKVQHDVQTLLLKGKINNYPKLLNADANLTGESHIHIKNMPNEIELPDSIKLDSGVAHLNFKANYTQSKILGEGQLSISDLRSNVLFADKLNADIKFEDDKLMLDKFSFSYGNENAELSKPSQLYNFKLKEVLPEIIEADVENVSLNNALRILGPSMEPLQGELTGKVNFNYKNGNYHFKPYDHFIIRNLGLVVGKEKPFTVLMIKKGTISNGSFRIVKNEFQMDADIQLAHSKLSVKGLVNSKKVNFESHSAQVDFEDFGNIANLDVKGKGTIDINVSGPLDDTVINLTGLTNQFGILGYNLGKSDKDISIALRDSEVIINKLESQVGSTKLSGTGAVNYGNLDIALDIKSELAYFQDLEKILDPIFSKLTFLPEDLDLNAKIDASIYGKTRLKDLKVKSNVNFKDLHAYGENFRFGEFSVGMSDEVISINNLEAHKARGELAGDFSYSMNTERMKVNYRWDSLPLESFNVIKRINLNLGGELAGTFKGEGTTRDYLFNLQGKMYDTKSSTSHFEDSNFDLEIRPKRISGDINFLGEIISAKFDYSLNHTKASRLDFHVDAPEIKPFLATLLGQQLDQENISGSFKFDLSTKFLDGFTHLDLEANLKELIFKHEAFNVEYTSNKPQLKVENSEIRSWNLNIQQKDLFMLSKGDGVFGKHVTLNHDIYFNSKILEILIGSILSSEGFIRNSLRIEGSGNKFGTALTSKASDLDITLEDVPFPLNDLNYSIDYAQNKIYIQHFSTSLENGTISLRGDIFMDEDGPDINVKYVLDKAEIPILAKSSINISGEGILLGNNMPYTLGGDVIINKAQIINEINEFSSKSSALNQVRFLPKNQESIIEKYLTINVNVKAEAPVRVTNSLMDVALKGDLNLSGSPMRPRADGHLFAPPNSSRIFFKSNEYFITSADINFSKKKEISNPDFDVQAMTTISNYKVYPKAYGDLERFSFDLTSDPPLTRNSIFSLIAFGYTNELQNSLDPKEQQKLSQVGVGSFVFDRFKISDILNKQFGLQVNLGTVFEQDQSSMISGRSTEGQGTLGRVRSATKIELKKRLSEATTLSVSSTMGGDIGQRQSMNLNYGVNKQVSLEGIYEVRTNADGQEDIIDTSIGGDIKFRKTFK